PSTHHSPLLPPLLPTASSRRCPSSRHPGPPTVLQRQEHNSGCSSLSAGWLRLGCAWARLSDRAPHRGSCVSWKRSTCTRCGPSRQLRIRCCLGPLGWKRRGVLLDRKKIPRSASFLNHARSCHGEE